MVRADHSNGVPRNLLNAELAASLMPDQLTAYAGPENGYVLTFTNGLVAYLSGDTGHTSDMATIVSEYYRPILQSCTWATSLIWDLKKLHSQLSA